jgi:CBS domain-containing protein
VTANDVSALPVIGTDGRLTGIISEANLLRRKEIATATNRPSWVETITPATTVAAEFVKAHGKRVADLMSKDVISVGETATSTPGLAQSLRDVHVHARVSQVK